MPDRLSVPEHYPGRRLGGPEPYPVAPPAPVARIPDHDEYRREWSTLDYKHRRRILKAVNRGKALDKRKDAALAVATARSQKGFWSKAWMFGPIGALFTLLSEPNWAIYIANALVLTAIMALMSWFWLRRVRRAEEANLAVATGQRRKKRGSKQRPGRTGGGGHLPS